MIETREVESETISQKTLRATTRNMVAPHSRDRNFFIIGDEVRVFLDDRWIPGEVIEPLVGQSFRKVSVLLDSHARVIFDVCSNKICHNFDGFDPTALPVAYTVAEFTLSS